MCLSAGDFDHCHLPIIMERRAHILTSWLVVIYLSFIRPQIWMKRPFHAASVTTLTPADFHSSWMMIVWLTGDLAIST